MKRNISICKTEFNNHYLASQQEQYHIYLSPIILYLIENEPQSIPVKLVIGEREYNKEEINYYYNKYIFLMNHGLIKEIKDPEQSTMSHTPNRIKWQLANLKSLVFEVTDACNLKCKYCAYGEFYVDYDERTNRQMTFETAKAILDYLIDLWNSPLNSSLKRKLTFGFYGGEPLLSINLIKEIISYIENNVPASIIPQYNMTSNAMLLDRHMDYLVQKDFQLLISLDGNEQNHSYRVTHDGINSFRRVYKNVNLLRKKHPVFFVKNVNFNSVLHNRNSVKDIFNFINTEFDKMPMIGELNSNGISPDKVDEYNLTYKDKREDLHQSENYNQLAEKVRLNNPDFESAVKFAQRHSGNFFKNYSDLFRKDVSKRKGYLPTGTCIPFERKLFLTVRGKILPCERIGQEYDMGRIIDNKVEIDFDFIAQKYNNYFEKLKPQCNHCYTSVCSQCIFNLPDLEGKPICMGSQNLKLFNQYISNNLSFFEQNSKTFKESLKIMFE
jgi:uncharacterized protein